MVEGSRLGVWCNRLRHRRNAGGGFDRACKRSLFQEDERLPGAGPAGLESLT